MNVRLGNPVPLPTITYLFERSCSSSYDLHLQSPTSFEPTDSAHPPTISRPRLRQLHGNLHLPQGQEDPNLSCATSNEWGVSMYPAYSFTSSTTLSRRIITSLYSL